MSAFTSLVARVLGRGQPPGPVLLDDPLTRTVGGDALARGLSSSLMRNEPSARRGTAEVFELYREAPWLRATAHKVGSGVAACEWKLYARRDAATARRRDVPGRYVLDERLTRMPPGQRHIAIQRAVADGDLEEFESHPLLRLLERPNPRMSGFETRFVTTVHKDLAGEAFWVVDVDKNNVPYRAWPIPPTWVKSTPTPREPVFHVAFPEFEGDVPADLMLWFRDVDPANPYGRGAGMGVALADELDIDEGAAKTTKGYFENQAIPPLLVSLKGASQERVARARVTWERALKGFRRAYQTFFTGSEIDVQRLDTSFKDMALVDLRRAQRDIVIQTWGVPPEKLGIIENSNRSTIDASDLIYAQEVLLPRLEALRSTLQIRIVPRWDPRLILDYVSPIPEDKAAQRALMQALPQYVSIDEMRAAQGLSPLPDGRGQGFLVQQSLQYVSDLAKLQAGNIFGYHLASGIPTVNEVRHQLGLPPRADGDVPTTAGLLPGLAPPAPVKVEADPDPLVPEGEPKNEPAPEQPVVDNPDDESVVASRGKVAAAHLSKAAHDLDPAHSLATGTRSLTAKAIRGILGQLDAEPLADNLKPVIEKLVDTFGRETMKVLDAKQQFDIEDPAIETHLRELTTDRIGRLVNNTTRDELKATIAAWDGDDDEALVKQVRDVFERARVERSLTIAATEGQRAKELATHTAMKQSGFDLGKEWVAVADSRTREAHLKLDGQTVGVDDPFTVPDGAPYAGAQAQSPGYFGIAGLDINCRCQSAPVFDYEAPAPEGDGRASRSELLEAGVLVRGATAEERANLWRAQDAKLRRWEARLSDACIEGFDEQERAVVAALLKALG